MTETDNYHKNQEFPEIDTKLKIYIPGFNPDDNIEKVQEGLNNIPSSASWDPVFPNNVATFHDYDEAFFRNIQMDVKVPKISFVANNYGKSYINDLGNRTTIIEYNYVAGSTDGCCGGSPAVYSFSTSYDINSYINYSEFSDKNIIGLENKLTNIHPSLINNNDLITLQNFLQSNNIHLSQVMIMNNDETDYDPLKSFITFTTDYEAFSTPTNLFQIETTLEYIEDGQIKTSNKLINTYSLIDGTITGCCGFGC